MHGRARKLEGAALGPALEVLWPLGGRGEAAVRRPVMKAWKKTGGQRRKKKAARRTALKRLSLLNDGA